MAKFKLKGLNKSMDSNTYGAPSGTLYRFWNPNRNIPGEETEVTNPKDIEFFRGRPQSFEEIGAVVQTAKATESVVKKVAGAIAGRR